MFSFSFASIIIIHIYATALEAETEGARGSIVDFFIFHRGALALRCREKILRTDAWFSHAQFFGNPSHGHAGIPQRSNRFFAGKDIGTISDSIYHMVTGTGILDAQNSWHGDYNYRDRPGRQQKINNTPPSPFGFL
jgi:hypothetical protein